MPQVCSCCHETKDESDFYRRPSGKPMSRCKACTVMKVVEGREMASAPSPDLAARVDSLETRLGLERARYEEVVRELGLEVGSDRHCDVISRIQKLITICDRRSVREVREDLGVVR